MSQSAFDGRIAYASYIPINTLAAFDLGSAAKPFRSSYFETAIIGTSNTLDIRTDTVLASDTAVIQIAASSSPGSLRSGEIFVYGNEEAGGFGQVHIYGGSTDIGSGAGDIDIVTWNTVGGISFGTVGVFRAAIDINGDFKTDATNGGNIVVQRAGFGFQALAGSISTDVTTAFGTYPAILVIANQNSFDGYVNGSFGNNASGALFKGFKTRSASSAADADTIVQVGDALVTFSGFGADGAAYKIGGSLSFIVDAAGTPALNSIPTKMVFSVVAPGGTSQDSRLAITSPGTLFVAKNITQLDTDITSAFGSGGYIPFVIQTNNATNDGALFIQTGSTTAGFELYGVKTRSSSGDANTAVVTGDQLLNIGSYGADGTVYRRSSSIKFFCEGTIASNRIPGRIEFGVGADSAGNADLRRLFIDSAGDIQTDATNGGNLVVNRLGKTLKLKEGANAVMGRSTLVAGTVTVNTTAVTAASEIFLTSQVDGGTPGFVRVTARTAGTSFTITSSNVLDTSDIAWVILEPA